MVEHEIGILRTARMILTRFAMIEIAPFIEQVRTEARSLDRLQELLRNDRVGVDVGAIQRRDDSGVDAKRLHDGLDGSPLSVTSRARPHARHIVAFYALERRRRTSTKCPATAA